MRNRKIEVRQNERQGERKSDRASPPDTPYGVRWNGPVQIGRD